MLFKYKALLELNYLKWNNIIVLKIPKIAILLNQTNHKKISK